MIDAHNSFLDVFGDLEDPRIDRRKLHPLPEILLLTLSGMIAGCDGWQDLEDFGRMKLEFLRRYLPFENGVPSDDTLRRFFRALDPKAFGDKFREWVNGLGTLNGQVIAIDGKTARRSFDSDAGPLHLVSAFATEARLVLAQVSVSEKTNEITAIPELLEWLDLDGATVSIDAMGCQKEITKTIRAQGGAYVLALKKNHPQLHTQVEEFFADDDLATTASTAFSIEKGHGRIEERRCLVTSDIDWLYGKSDWRGLKSIAVIESVRCIAGEEQREKRYYISSLAAEPDAVLDATRSHWGIENSLHWILDMSFGEDQSRIRKGNAPQNMALVRKAALNLLQCYKSPRQSIKRLRKLAGWDEDTLSAILSLQGDF